jgi:hypothetical protein
MSYYILYRPFLLTERVFYLMTWGYALLFILGGLSALAGAGVIPLPTKEVRK